MEFPSYFKHVRTPTPESNVPTQISETRGLKTLARKIPSQRWEFTFNGFTYNGGCNSSYNESIKFFGEFVSRAENGYGIFDYKPNDEFLIGALNIKLEESIVAGDDYFLISVSPKPDSADAIIGKLFKFSTETKAYMISNATLFGSTADTAFYRITTNIGSRFDQNEDTTIISGATMRIKLRVDGGVGRGVTSNLVRDKTVYQFKMIEVI